MSGKHWLTLSREARDAIAQEATEHGVRSVSRRTGIPRSTIYVWQCQAGLKDRYKAADSQEEPPTFGDDGPVENEEQVFGPDTWTITMKSLKVQTYEQLVEHCKVDLAEWSRVEFKVKSYQMTYVPRATRKTDKDKWVRPSTDAVTVQMYGLTARFAKKTPVVDARKELDDVIAAAKGRVAPAPLIYLPKRDTGFMLEISIPDHHLGKLAWGSETGGPNYDLKIAVDVFRKAFEGLLERTSHFTFEKVLFVVGNDALHIDSNAGTTTRGTPQDHDGRYFKVFQAARNAHLEAADRLLAYVAPKLHILGMPGNHDGVAALHLVDSMGCYYARDPNVVVDSSPLPRKYVEYGQNLLAFTHGDEGKPRDWADLIATEAVGAWGRTTYREVHVGHLHKDGLERDEHRGVKIRRLPSLAPADAWHARKGYVGNIPSAEAFVWHKDKGLFTTAVYNHVYEDVA